MVVPMIDPKIFDDMARRLADSLPSGLKVLQDDLEKNFRAVIQSVLGKMDLVTREEFDVQTEVLARTRAKVEALEKELTDLESKSQGSEQPK
jgi:BMFP domain-containing protein YqiC